MTHFVPRTCTEIADKDNAQSGAENSSRLLKDFREADAYVLLGAPGAGKTVAFKQEVECTGGCYVTARELDTFGDRPEWHNATLFIDGLDEIRAGSADGRTSLDRIRNKLNTLGCPRFRLSCREADWFGANDRTRLEKVSRNGKVKVLRLDPLTDDNISDILRWHSNITDADGFITSARERGIDSLLANPQSLQMLADAVAGGIWPETRMETFGLACQTLLREHNEEHQIAKSVDPDCTDISGMMSAAGQLCAVQLLTGSAGWYTLPGCGSDREYLKLEQISGGNQSTFLHVLDTKLFEAPSEVRVMPVHRHVAEFLAARYLANLINNDLPVRRILSLLTSHDGGIVSELRGLSAWLAAHSKTSRPEFIARDPLGTVLYGDARGFSTKEKRQVLDRLGREAKRNPWFVKTIQVDSRLGDLATDDMEEHFRKILTAPERDDAQQSLVLILVEILGHGQALPRLAALMMDILKDDAWWPRIKHRAVDAYIRFQGNTTKLKTLTEDVYAERVSDPEDDLLGHLLTELYPREMSPQEVVQYLRKPKKPNYCPEYEYFWTGHLAKKSTTIQIAQLLDELLAGYDQLRTEVQKYRQPIFFLREMPLVLLRRFLETSHEEIDTKRLFDWLGVAMWGDDWNYGAAARSDEEKYICSWIEGRPELQESLIEIGVERCVHSSRCTNLSDFNRCMRRLKSRLFNARPPADFGSWCLDQAMAATDRNVADYFIHKVADFLHHRLYDEGLSQKVVEEHIAVNNALVNSFNKRLAELEEDRDQDKSSEESHETQRKQRQRQWRESLRPYETALRENRCYPQVLHRLALAYYGNYVDVVGDTPKERLQDLLGGDENLIQTVLDGLRESINRNNLPSDSEIIRLEVRNQTHLLVYPFMAGLEETVRATQNHEISLDEKQMRLALAIYYTVPVPPLSQCHGDRMPSWFPPLLKSHPDVVSDVLVRCVRPRLRNGADTIPSLYELAFSPDHANIARLASLPLLEAFPVRCTKQQLSSLNHLLIAAFLHCERLSLLKLLDRKLAHRSMNVAQRIYWLFAGLLAEPTSYLERLASYTAGNERRLRCLAAVQTQEVIECLTVPTLQLLVRLIGSSCRPYSLDSTSEEDIIVTSAMIAADHIRRFINRLASVPSPAATDALETLSSDDALLPWRSYLNDAKYQQNITRREAEFQHPEVEQVLQVIDNRKPANAADLAALTFEYLREISKSIRDGNTSDWRQYWNVDSYNRPQNPKPEDPCRDALLSALQDRLKQLSIDAQPEGRYANDKRSDIRVYYGSFNVPVEVKRSCHRDLWSAIKTQLIAKYTRDLGADSYGIYLVFWFGDTEHCRPTPGEGRRPKSATELEKRLLDMLSEDEKRKISIYVIDVAKPET